jgi:hypothetical protein
MQKPPETHIWIYDNCPIHAIKVDEVMTGCDSAETWVTLIGRTGERRIKWAELRNILEVSVDWSSVARLRGSYSDEVAKWKKFEKQNAEDLKEFERLKAKLGISA